MKILVAEDDATSRVLLERVLVKWGYEVVAVGDGSAAWDILRQPQAPLMAILDWMMPGLDGPEVCRRIRTLEEHDPIYVILVTARAEKEDIIAGLDAGANDYIKKPYDTNELRARINAGCRVVELQTALTNRARELQDALDHIKTLQGILPICMHCHKIRNDQESWERLDKYLTDHTQATLSHSLCPECLEEHYPEHKPKNNATAN